MDLSANMQLIVCTLYICINGTLFKEIIFNLADLNSC